MLNPLSEQGLLTDHEYLNFITCVHDATDQAIPESRVRLKTSSPPPFFFFFYVRFDHRVEEFDELRVELGAGTQSYFLQSMVRG